VYSNPKQTIINKLRFPQRRPGFDTGHLGFAVDKVALGQAFSEYFVFLCLFSFHQLFLFH
jgi:hypothetical protein